MAFGGDGLEYPPNGGAGWLIARLRFAPINNNDKNPSFPLRLNSLPATPVLINPTGC